MKIKVSKLNEIFSETIDTLQSLDVDEIEIDTDFYWEIPLQKIHNIDEEPDEFFIGVYQDDIDELEDWSKDRYEHLTFHLLYLSAILRWMSTKTIWEISGDHEE